MAEKKPRVRKKAAPKVAKATGPQQQTLLTLFSSKRPATSEDAVDLSSEAEAGGQSEAESVIDVESSPHPPLRLPETSGTSKRARERDPSPPRSVTSSLSSVPSRATSPAPAPAPTPTPRRIFSSQATDVYSELRRSRARSVALLDEDTPKPAKGRTFAVVRKARSRPILTPATSQETLEGSQGAPIEIMEEELEPEPVVPLTSAAVHAFFKPRREKEQEKDKGKGKEKETSSVLTPRFGTKTKAGRLQKGGDGLDAPWPNAERAHVGSEADNRLETKSSPVPRRAVPASTSEPVAEEHTAAWARSYAQHEPDDALDLSPRWLDAVEGLRNPEPIPDEIIPEEHAKHPAIARLLGPDGAKHAFAPPGRACEILGNEAPAQELADWMKSLELRGGKEQELPVPAKGKPRERRVVVTEVDRRKRRRVENQNEYDPSFVMDDFADPDDYEIIYDIGNTFVITGPTGTGKSAAVHACAQELGWSVFEVYAGIGRRGTGANGLSSLIGSVGANHTVGGSGDGEVQQSLILLDEVDLVFGQDTQFWSAIFGLIRESRRPVVLIANDRFSIPSDELPVHRQVEFQAASPELAGSYLYAQAQAAGCAHVPPRAQFRTLFKEAVSAPRIPDFAVPDEPQHPSPAQLDRSHDLRRALEEMKFWLVNRQDGRVYADDTPRDVREVWAACGWDIIEWVGDWSAKEIVRENESQPDKRLDRLWQFADNLSAVDAGLERPWTRQMQAEEVDRLEPREEDDEAQADQLCKPWVRDEEVGIAEYCRDAEMALEAVCTARRVLESSGAGGYARAGLVGRRRRLDSRWLEEVRAEHQERLVRFLDERILATASPLLPCAALVLDFIPAIRTMVAADDAMVASASRIVRGRNVRTSARVAAAAVGRVQQERYISLGPEELAAVHATEFCVT